MRNDRGNHYATLGLDRGCSDSRIREAYRSLARRLHPDLNGGDRDALARTQALNAAYEVLGDVARRRAYDEELDQASRRAVGVRSSAVALREDVRVGIRELLRGTRLTVRIGDPCDPCGAETLELEIPPGTAAGTRFRLQRAAPRERDSVVVRVRARPDPRFKVRGADLRCDLRIAARRAAAGGVETLRGAMGNGVRVAIPPRVARGEIIRVPGEGLPRVRGGRGDLLVRILYRPDVRIARAGGA